MYKMTCILLMTRKFFMLFYNFLDFKLKIVDYPQKIMGLDVGDKTIGVAISDSMGIAATPTFVIKRISIAKDINEISRLVQEYETKSIVIGYPLNMDGSEGDRCALTSKFALQISDHIMQPILMWDERLSTVAVERTLITADVSRAKRKKVVDKMAACFILQGVLDRFALGG